ncbi:MAG: hypothetical protein ABFD54_02920 [Armatimonadota bacterium]|nr:hypothetical protein [bacterium]
MIKRGLTIAALAALTLATTSAFAYSFWGVNISTATRDSATQVTFDGLNGSDIQYTVGGWKYTRVDGTWYGPYTAPTPGEGYLASRRSDAQGLFFRADSNGANFVIITTASQNGQGAPEVGFDQRLFGPGDLRIDVGGTTFGVGMRIDNLLWAQDTTATGAQYQLYGVDNQILDMHARDNGTLGVVEMNPLWGRAGNQSLPAGSDLASAFFLSGSGTTVGSANVSFIDTGIAYNGAHVYAYEVTLPWAALGLSPDNYNFTASWRPDCGNDLITGDFSAKSGDHVGYVPNQTPEPAGIMAIATGIIGLAGAWRRR